jgi:DNA-binding transcriptional LysR family regulator
VSRAIADLEVELGLRLFQRTTRSMTLTEAGELYLTRVEPLIEELARAREAAAQVSGALTGALIGAPRGLLRLTASVTFGQMRIVPLLGAFRARYPDLQVEGVFTDANVDLVADRIDLAIRLAPVVEGDVIAAKLMDTRYRVVASPGYLAAHPPIARPTDLSAHKVLLFTIKAFRTRWLFRDPGGREQAVPISGDITLSPAGSLLAAALAGLGPALLPDWLVDDAIAAGSLVRLLPDHAVTATTFDTGAWLVYPSRAYLPNKVRVMADFLREKLA